MNEKIKKQQTLFRFVSLRAPEKSDNENQEKDLFFILTIQVAYFLPIKIKLSIPKTNGKNL